MPLGNIANSIDGGAERVPWRGMENTSGPNPSPTPSFSAPGQGTFASIRDGAAGDEARALRITAGASVWVFEGAAWWRALVIHEMGGYCIVRLDHGVTFPAYARDLMLRDPGRNGADRPAHRH